MALTIADLKEWNEEYFANKNPEPIVLAGKYRLRYVPLNQIPILSGFSDDVKKDFHDTHFLVVDSPISGEKLDATSGLKVEEAQRDEIENVENIENGAEGPLRVPLLNVENLNKAGIDTNNPLYNLEDSYFDCNAISNREALDLPAKICSLKGVLEEDLLNMPLLILTKDSSLPSISLVLNGKSGEKVYSGNTISFGRCSQEVEQRAISLSNRMNSPLLKVKTSLRAIYTIIEPKATKTRHNPGRLTCQMTWKEQGLTSLMSPAKFDADVTIRIDPGWKDERFFMANIDLDLLLVLNLVEILRHPDEDIQLTELRTKPEVDQKVDEVLELYSTEVQPEEGLTDRIWECLAACDDIRHVSKILTRFLQAAQLRKLIPQVDSSDRSQLARLLKESKTTAGFHLPRLERLSTAEMMLETGVEYITRNLMKMFTQDFLFPTSDLLEVIKECSDKLVNTWGATEARAAALIPACQAYKTVMRLKSVVDLKTQSFSAQITRKVLEKYAKRIQSSEGDTNVHKDYLFELTTRMADLHKDLLQSQSLSIWSSESSFYRGSALHGRTITILTEKAPFKHLEHLAVDENMEKTEKDEYYVSQTVYRFE